jgi:hypothetical protein
MNEHRCPLREGREPPELTEWTCPECGRHYVREPKTAPPVAPSLDFEATEVPRPSTRFRRVG